MRTGKDYEYFYDVDGEHRYDFDCEFESVEVRQTSQWLPKIQQGQIIIANTIQIESKTDAESVPSFMGSASSNFSNSSNEMNPEDDWFGNGPVVTWPAYLKQLVNQVKPSKDTMTMKFTDFTIDSEEITYSAVVSSNSSGKVSSSHGMYYPTAYYGKNNEHSFNQKMPMTKRVYFWDTSAPASVAEQNHGAAF